MFNQPILVVDPNPMHRRLAKDLLENEGCKVLTTGNSWEAIQILKYFHPLVVLADFFMPGLNGPQFAGRIKRNARTRDIKVLLMTSLSSKAIEEEPFTANCDGFLLKPIDSKAVMEKMGSFYLSKAEGF